MERNGSTKTEMVTETTLPAKMLMSAHLSLEHRSLTSSVALTMAMAIAMSLNLQALQGILRNGRIQITTDSAIIRMAPLQTYVQTRLIHRKTASTRTAVY